MNAVADLSSRLGRALLRFALGLAAAVFLLSLLLAALIAVVGVSLWSLFTGRRPAPLVLFTRLRERAHKQAGSPWRHAAPRARAQADRVEIVDVQAREIDETPVRRQP